MGNVKPGKPALQNLFQGEIYITTLALSKVLKDIDDLGAFQETGNCLLLVGLLLAANDTYQDDPLVPHWNFVIMLCVSCTNCEIFSL